ncbi:hypothetical protein D3C72_1557610 [compost metagenome]
MPNQIFGRRLNRDVDVKIEGFKQHARRPGIVDHDDGVRRDAAYRANDGRNVMHFHCDRAGRFQEHDARIWLNKFCDPFADQRIEPAGGDAQTGQNFGAEILARLVGGVGHQDMVALFNKRQNSIGYRRCAAREQRTTDTAFQLAHRFLQ